MKTLLLSTTFLAIGSVAATAAPAFDWSGCYVGAHVGAAAVRAFAATDFEGSGNIGDNGTGTIAGGQAGCNYQQSNWVVGVEGEGAWSNGKATNSLTLSREDSFTLTTKNTGIFSIAARAGFAFDRTLIYGKAGWAVASFDFNSTLNCCLALPDSRSASGTKGAFLVGAGAEYALMRNWSVKFEYNYSDFGSRILNIGADPNGNPALVNTSIKMHTFKVGINYLFDFGRMSVAAQR
jgi:outer membrane immunogenic protein